MANLESDNVLSEWAGHMRRGNFASAWRISDEARWPVDLPRYLRPVWCGSSLTGRHVLIRCYRGLGDTIQFIRYVPLLNSLASEVTVSAQAELIPLLRTMPAIGRLVALDRENPPSYEVQVEVMELPYVFRTTINTIPANIPYFDVASARLPTDGKLAVGIVWAAGDWDPRRSIPLSQLAQLGEVPDVNLFSFQYGAARQQLDELRITTLNWRNITHEAELLRGLDLLISVDTMPAHLAGALGIPVWLLLHSDPDWRWLDQRRDDSPWYPTMRLFRQRRDGDWKPPLNHIADELRALSINFSNQRCGKNQETL